MAHTRIIAAATVMASLALLAGCAEVTTSDSGDGDPDGPVQIIVPNAAGGASDTIARLLAEELTKTEGRKFSVVNVDSAGGQLGVQQLADAEPDGSTIGMTNIPTVIGLYTDPERDADFDRTNFTPLAGLNSSYLGVAVNTDSPYRTFEDLIAAAKENPGEISFATGGALSNDHLAGLDIEEKTGADFNIVHLDGGSAKMTALLGNKIDVVPGGPSAFVSQEEAGTVRVLAALGPEGSGFGSDVPTAESLGYDITQPTGFYLSGPAGLPDEIVEDYDAALEAALDNSDIVEKMDALGYAPKFMPSDKFAAFWEEQDELQVPLLESAIAEE